MSDDERELAIKDAGAALVEAQAHLMRCRASYAASGCFAHAADVDTATAARDDAKRYMEALIRGRSAARVLSMERALEARIAGNRQEKSDRIDCRT